MSLILFSPLPSFAQTVEHLGLPCTEKALTTTCTAMGKNQMRMMSKRKVELLLESCDQTMTGWMQMKGWITVRMTSSVVRISRFSLLEPRFNSLLGTWNRSEYDFGGKPFLSSKHT